jgi:hypothetical protein
MYNGTDTGQMCAIYFAKILQNNVFAAHCWLMTGAKMMTR